MPKTEKSRRELFKQIVMKKIVIFLLLPVAIICMSAKNVTTEFGTRNNHSKLKRPLPKIIEPGQTSVVPGPIAVLPFENISIYRMQLRIYTCNNNDGPTDDDVYVQMNDTDERFFLDKGIDDFRKGGNDTYDILSPTIKKISDINFLKIGIRGDDAICIRRVQLFLNNNNSPVFSKSFTGHGKLIDNSQFYTIPGSELRSYSGWALTSEHQNMSRAPRHISKSMILSLVECSIGNRLNYGPQFGWGSKVWGLPNTRFGPVVEVNFVNSKTLHFDLDLQGKEKGPNREVDIDFDLIFSCDNGLIKTEIKNVTYGTNWIGELRDWLRDKGAVLIGTAIGTEVGHPVVGGAAGASLSKYLSFKMNIDLPNQNVLSSCESINILPTCDIKLR